MKRARHAAPGLHATAAVAEARRELEVAELEAYIQRVVDEAPTLSSEQRDRLAVLLRGTS